MSIDTQHRTIRAGQPDPNTCPHCGATALRELDLVARWQPVTMTTDERGIPTPLDYPARWKVADEGQDVSYECGECAAEWPSVYALGHAQRVTHTLRAYRDFWESRAERLQLRADAGRIDYVDAAEKIADALARSDAYAHVLAILRGNGEA